MINDFINLTQGQLLIKYWWLWVSILFVFTLYIIWDKGAVKVSRKTKTIDNKYESIRADAYIGSEKDNLYIRPSEQGSIKPTTNEKQLDRIEKKLDSILETLNEKELPNKGKVEVLEQTILSLEAQVNHLQGEVIKLQDRLFKK